MEIFHKISLDVLCQQNYDCVFFVCVFQYDAEMERRLQEQKRHEQHQQQNQTNEYREPKISNVPAGLQNGQVGDPTSRDYRVIARIITHPMLRLLSSEVQQCKDFWKPSKPCHAGINWRALAQYSQMSTHMPGFQSFFSCFFASFCSGKISHQQH